MFDLIDESGSDLKKYGYTIKNLNKFGISEASLKVDSKEKSERIGLEMGEYYIFNSPLVYDYGMENMTFLISLMSKRLKEMVNNFSLKKSKILIVGLGNPDISADRLGKEVFDNIEINPLKIKNIYKFCPNIYFSTGIDTLEMVKMFVKELNIDLLIIVDSLSTSSLERLGTSFQISNAGMTPGSGVNRFGKRICKQSVGAYCISIGVPFMIFSGSLTKNDDFEVVLTPKDVRENVKDAGFIISKVISEVIKWTIFCLYLLR